MSNRMRLLLVLLCATAGPVSPTAAGGRILTFDDRVVAQGAIERTYYAHQIGTTRSFEFAVPHELLERKVRAYLAESAALEQLWKTPITADMLRRELERMAAGSRMPDRLLELYRALGDDSVLIQECLARPILVERMSRSFFEHDASLCRGERSKESWGTWLGEYAREVSDRSETVAEAGDTLPAPGGRAEATTTCTPDDAWDSAIAAYPPRPRSLHGAVWTGSLMLIWGNEVDGARYDPATDTWSRMPGGPVPRALHSTVWTGNRMVIWGGIPRSDPTAVLHDGDAYDPVANQWTGISNTNAPAGRQGHTAIWDGTRMVVFGGQDSDGTVLGSGGRYDPVAGSWTPTSSVGAPAPRVYHSAVWSGARMLVWGGQSGSLRLGSGGRYDPAADFWTPMNAANAPSARSFHGAVWTGTRMLIWGGGDGSTALATGARYDPAADTWSAMTTTGAPSATSRPTLVWIGTRMLVWTGQGAGGRYDPTADAWATMNTAGAPAARAGHSAVWTGSLMVVWGGLGLDSAPLHSGGRYDPASDSWTPTADGGSPSAKALNSQSALWTGTRMIVFGSEATDLYDPATARWYSPAIPGPRIQPSATVWTGALALDWGTDSDTQAVAGMRYDPIADVWTPMSASGGVGGSPGVWTGSQMLVWSGQQAPMSTAGVGARYDPPSDTWTPMSLTGAPTARSGHAIVWTGARMIVWGGRRFSADLNSGGAYDPLTDTWSATSTTGAPSVRRNAAIVWTGSRMIVWGGIASTELNTGGRYDPATDTWSPVSTISAPSPRTTIATWTGSRMLVWGGINGSSPGTGGRYDPVGDSWTPMSTVNAFPASPGTPRVWTGRQLILWFHPSGAAWSIIEDGDDDGYSACNGDCDDTRAAIHPGSPEICDGLDDNCDGGVPADEIDDDGDGYVECFPWLGGTDESLLAATAGGDCDDADNHTYPGASEVNDGRDNECPGDRGRGIVDEISGTLLFLPGKTRVAWPAQSGATLYEIARSPVPDFLTSCHVVQSASAFVDDSELPGSRAVLTIWFARCSRTWGAGDSDRTAPSAPECVPESRRRMRAKNVQDGSPISCQR